MKSFNRNQIACSTTLKEEELNASACFMRLVIDGQYTDSVGREELKFEYREKKKRANFLRSLLQRRNAIFPALIMCIINIPHVAAQATYSEIIAHDPIIFDMLCLLAYLLCIFVCIACVIACVDNPSEFNVSSDLENYNTPFSLNITPQGDEDIILNKKKQTYSLDEYISTERFKKRYRERIRRKYWRSYEAQGFINDLHSKTASMKQNFKDDPDFYVKFIEDFLNLMVGIHYSRINGKFDKARLARELIVFLKLRTNKSLSNKVFRFYYDFILKKFYEDIGEPTPTETENFEDFTPQSFEEFISTCKDYSVHFKDVKNSKMLKQLQKFFLSLISLSIFDNLGIPFDKIGYGVLEREALKRKNSSLNIIEIFMDTAIYVCEVGYQCYVTKSVQPMYHSSKDYAKWFERTNEVTEMSKYHTCQEAYKREFGKDYNESEFATKLDGVIEHGENMLSFAAQLTPYEHEKLRFRVNNMKSLRMDLYTTKACRAGRKSPFSILIFGESGIGKSSVQDMVYYHCCKLMKLSPDISNRYTLNPAAKHMDGMSRGTHTILIDDVAAKNPDMGEDATIDYIIQLINNVPFVAPMAALEDKGKVPFRGKMVIGSTNVEHLNAFKYYSHPSAIQRRFPYIIEPQLKPEYKNDKNMLDVDKIPAPIDGSYPDYWTFTVKRVKCRSVKVLFKPADIEIVHHRLTQPEFLEWLNQAVDKHNEVQDKVEHCNKIMEKLDLCMCCRMPDNLCKSSPTNPYPQGLIEDVVYFYSSYWQLATNAATWFTLRALSLTSACPIIGPYLNRYLVDFAIRYFDEANSVNFERSFYEFLGNRVSQTCFQVSGYLAGYVIGFVAAKAAISLLNIFTTKPDTQGAEESKPTCSEGSVPEPESNGRENVWYKNEYTLSSFDVGPVVNSTKGLTRDQFVKIIENNLIYYELSTPLEGGMIRRSKGKAVCLGGHYYLFNKHLFKPNDNSTLSALTMKKTPGVNGNKSFKVTPFQVEEVYEDLILVLLPNMLAKRDISIFFPVKEVRCKSSGFYVSRDSEGNLEYNNVDKIEFKYGVKIQSLAPMNSWEGRTIDRPTRNGDCGGLLILESPQGYFIGGLHYAGNGNSALSIAIHKEMLPQKDDMFSTQGSSHDFLGTKDYPKEVGSLHHKSTLRYLEKGECDAYGSFTGFIPCPRSTVCNTPLNSTLAEYGYETKCTRPQMAGWLPKRIAIMEMVQPISQMNFEVICKAKDSLLNKIRTQLSESDFRKLTPYTQFTAVNGAAGVAYVDKINRGTSAGFPWNKSKKHFLESIPPDHGLEDPVTITEEIQWRVDALLKKLSEGKRCYPVFKCHLKDEAVSFKKAKMGKTRVFAGAPMDFTIVVRRFYLAFIRVLQSNKFIFESAPGTISQSIEWQLIYEYLTKFGLDRIVAGDYVKFDKRMTPAVMMKAFELIVDLCELSNNFTEIDIKIMRAIAEDISFPFVDFFGDLIQFHGSNPSGHPLTVIINGLVNCIYMRYAYHELNPEKECDSFHENVNLMTYGDDNIMGVRNTHDWFNHTDIARILEDVGIGYTMADKEAESVPFIHIDEANFLKRSWRYDADIGAIVCPLEHDSIEKMLMTWTRSKSICEQEQIIAVVTSANMEYFWYGKDVYHAKQKLLKQVLYEKKLTLWIEQSTFPTWEALRERFWKYSDSLGEIDC